MWPQVATLFDVCDLGTAQGKRDRVVLGLLVGAGLRRAEAVRLNWSDVARREICGRVFTVVHVRGRGRRERQLVVSDWLGEALDVWRDASEQIGPVLRRFWRGGHLGPALTAAGLLRIVSDLGRVAGLAGLTPLDLRLTLACAQVRARGLEYASLVLGDADAQRTERGLGGCCGAGDGPVALLWTGGPAEGR